MGVKKIKNSGFTASASVLKLVNTIQKIGKKNTIATSQANAGQKMRPKVEVCATAAIGSIHQAFANHPQQEDGDDVGEDHSENARGTGSANIVRGKLANEVG